tara:strand:- start:12498 stop:13925 length:1428 start_codon:yes stop_codon:yes gene_type:complete
MNFKQQRDAFRERKISAKEAVQNALERVKADQNNIFINHFETESLNTAEEIDKNFENIKELPLSGVPIAHKDIFCTKNITTTCGSQMLENFKPPYDSTVVENCNNAGSIMIGKTNMDEFAMGSSNETSYFGPVDNPWNKKLVPGGSSGGAAACVAANITSISTGTDTGGSIRQPAALCGITGLKPTYGLVSRWGMIAFCSSMDQAGPFSKDAFGCAALLDAMSSFDIKDSTCSQRKEINYERCLDEDTKSLKIGVIKNLESFGISDSMLKAYEVSLTILESLGHKLIEVDFSELSSGICSYYVIAPAECSSNLSRFDGVKFGHRTNKQQDISELYMSTRAEGFGDEVKKRILIGTHVLSAGFYDAYYLKAQKVRRMIKNKFEEMYKDVDLIFMPTTLDQAFEKNRQSEDPNRMYKEDLLTIPANLAGLPAISFPNGFQNGLPTGGQLVGNYFQEDLLLQLTNKIQEVTDWHKMTP